MSKFNFRMCSLYNSQSEIDEEKLLSYLESTHHEYSKSVISSFLKVSIKVDLNVETSWP